MQVPRLLSTAELAVEVRRLLRLQQARTRRPAPEPVDLCPKDKRANLLLKWSQAACGLHGMRIHDVTTSFGDGRALCYLVGMRARVCACLCAAVCLGLLGVVRLPGVCVFDWLGAGLGGCGPGVLMPCVCVCVCTLWQHARACACVVPSPSGDGGEVGATLSAVTLLKGMACVGVGSWELLVRQTLEGRQ